MHSLVWDEAQKLAGKNADFNRADLWESIESGNYPEYELGIQVFDDAQADGFDFDILDPTKLIPEELVPVRRVGKMTLNRNPDNFFAETEQVAFCVSHVVPGIDFSNDPLLQGRIFSYLDTQLLRLGGPNFHQLPINRPICPFHNGQQDGPHQMEIKVNRTNYEPNSIDDNWPREKPAERGGFESYLETLRGDKRRVRAESFKDHFSQATLFWNSQTDVEKDHIVSAFGFELAKVSRTAIRERVLTRLASVDAELTARVAEQLGLEPPAAQRTEGDRPNGRAKKNGKTPPVSKALSIIANATGGTPKGRKIAILAADGVDGNAIEAMKKALAGAGAKGLVLSPRLGTLTSTSGNQVTVDHTIVTEPSVGFDAVYVPGGTESASTLTGSADAVHFVAEAYKHAKAIAASAEGIELLRAADLIEATDPPNDPSGVVTAEDGNLRTMTDRFLAAIARHRAWDRADKDAVPA